MKMRSLLMGLLVAASAQTAARAESVVLVDIMLAHKKAGVNTEAPNAIAEIKVDGALQKGPYDSVQNKPLEYVIAARTERHKKISGGPFLTLTVDGKGGFDDSGGSILDDDWQHYAVTRDYIDPRAAGMVGKRVSPVELCNDKLKAADGSARATFLKKGVSFLLKDAYEVNGLASAWLDTPGAFDEKVYESETIRVPVKITCMALDRPRPRTETTTKGPPPREGKKMQPTISEAKLRVEPAKVEQMGKFLCPMELKLYGYLETIRDFTGKSIFVGPHYLSAITDIKMTKAGSRNMTATYKMDWQQMGGFAVAPNKEPKKQSLSFKFNVSNKDGKVLESVTKSVEVSCKKIKVNAPVAGTDMTVAPTAPTD